MLLRGKIQDPEFDPSQAIQVDESLPKDPHIIDLTEYEKIAAKEKEIVLAVQEAELQSAGLKLKTGVNLIDAYRECLDGLSTLISAHPLYASARNNRAQANRRMYGDGMLINGPKQTDKPLITSEGDERTNAACQTLSDLDNCIMLLAPSGPQARLSPYAAKILSSAHTQRAAIYLHTSKQLVWGSVNVDTARREASWKKLDFEEAASLDFALGGRYGNEIAKGLAVSTNPTAKLCGQMVREAMKKEYGPVFSG